MRNRLKRVGSSIVLGASVFLLFPALLFGQNGEKVSWWNPAENPFPVLEGTAWVGETEDPYDRLPTRMKEVVRGPVWRLSKQSAGLSLRFYTNSPSIQVRYQIAGPEAMYHMPATGVSGMDLYALDSEGREHWIRGSRNSGDTISYTYSGITPTDGYHNLGREYTLYLPLYAQTRWLEIAVQDSSFFQPKARRTEKPIVVYGTSIAQGACATRPGTSWTGMLTRWMDRPLINLGFSGNGRLEPEIVELLGEIDAKVYILDCLPNLSADSEEQFNQVVDKIVQGVKSIRAKRPTTPILLADHAGYTDGSLIGSREKRYVRLNLAMQEALKSLELESNVFHIPIDAFGQTLETMVDGTHPNDLGMYLYAKGYEKHLREILKEPTGPHITMQPVRQRREPDLYEWYERHEQIIAYNVISNPETIILGNSITHFWGGEPEGPIRRSPHSWDSQLSSNTANFGIGWDRLENFLWRIYHDELDQIHPKTIVLLAGTNNMHLNTDSEIVDGIGFLIEAIRVRRPDVKIVLAGILPRDKMEDRLKKLNSRLNATYDGIDGVVYTDLGKGLINRKGKIDSRYFSDGLHPNKGGYEILSKQLSKILSNLD